MVLMAIDHVRVYSGIPSWGTTPGIFFTRWVTHFCVPTFVFFAGTSAFLYGQKINDSKKLSRFLLARGLLLIILEWTIIRFFWTFNLDYADFTLAGVIWMLGWCMILLGLVVRVTARPMRLSRCMLMGLIGGLMIGFQFLFSYVPRLLPASARGDFSWFWAFIYPTGIEDHRYITILYVLVPWIGVMMLGYCFGQIVLMDPAKRRKWCLGIGVLAVAAFIIASCIITLGHQGHAGQGHEDDRAFIYRFLDQRKYPPSILYLLMTLGPVIALVPFAEKVKGKIADVFIVFGRVPLFYYLIHIPLIHLAALLVNSIRQGSVHQEWYVTAPYTHVPETGRWGLPLLYLVFVLVEVVLYFSCRKYMKYKAANPDKKWLRYI
jgi:uncharacterized membrane protein